MIAGRRGKIVLLGMLGKIPVPGEIWLVAQYLLGLQRLGFDVYYVEANGMTPFRLMHQKDDDGLVLVSEFVASVMKRFDLSSHWAVHSPYDTRYFGMSESAVRDLYQSADLIINLHGCTIPLPEHSATGRLIYLETDTVEIEIELYDNDADAIAFLEPHVALFSWGLNYGAADCKVPLAPRFPFTRTCPPVLMDLWEPLATAAGELFTTVGNWRQHRTVTYQGEKYYWSKEREFSKYLTLPDRVGPQFELALSSGTCLESDRVLLREHGWQVRDSMEFANDPDGYRRYIAGSRGEFTVAKDQNVRLRSGWFGERSASYLAAGRPVVMQDTGFGNLLPTGEGLFPFLTTDEAAAAIEAINADYERHRRAALAIAREYLDASLVLGAMLEHMGLSPNPARV